MSPLSVPARAGGGARLVVLGPVHFWLLAGTLGGMLALLVVVLLAALLSA